MPAILTICTTEPQLILKRLAGEFYRAAAVWMGLVSFLFLAAVLLDYFRSGAASGAEYELPSDRGMSVRCRGNGRSLRSFQRKLDADHANDGAAR